MNAVVTQWDYDKSRMDAGIEQAQWDCLRIVLRFGVKSEIILHIAQVIRQMRKPCGFGCAYFSASEEFQESIPELIMTEKDYENLKYSENELKGIYKEGAYEGGLAFVQIAYIVYLLVAGVSVDKIVKMFKREKTYVEEIQNKLRKQVSDTDNYETFIQLFWEEKVYIILYQRDKKAVQMQAARKSIENLLKNTGFSLPVIADIFDVPIDAILRIMHSMGIKDRKEIPCWNDAKELTGDTKSEQGGGIAKSTATTSNV